MEIIKLKSTIIAGLFLGLSSLANSDPQNEEIIVACLKANPVMYFVPANKKLSSKIIEEMKLSIASGGINCKENNSWVCVESDFRVFQGHDGKGKKADFALICERSAGDGNFNYYSSEYLTQFNKCINASWYENKFEFN